MNGLHYKPPFRCQQGSFPRACWALLIVISACAPPAWAQIPASPPTPANPPTVSAAPKPSGAEPEQADGLRHVAPFSAGKAMVVTANPHATRAALAVLKAGGNAVDAAVTAQFVLNVVEPQSSGIGGGGFLVAYLREIKHPRSRVVTLDGREETPAGSRLEDFLAEDGKPLKFYPQRITGGRAVGVPGLLKMLELVLQRYGSWPLARTLEPAIKLAAEGFPVSPRMAGSLKRHQQRLAWFPATRAVFFGADGQTLKAKTLLRQPNLARAFRLLARDGSRAFYHGPIARDLVRTVREAPVGAGRLSLRDLAAYEAVFRTPVKSTYRGYTLYGMGPPSSGATTVFQLLNLLETRPPGPGGPYSALAIHRFVQAARLAYADRAAYLADPDFVAVPVAGLLDKAYARERAASIDWSAPLSPVRAGRPPGAIGATPAPAPAHEGLSTTHLSIADAQGNLLSMTTSIEQAFGSGMVVPGWGFFLNNQLTDFSMRSADAQGRPIANRHDPARKPRSSAREYPLATTTDGGKRPRSSMAPTLVLKDGRPVLILGSPGGSRIIQYVAEVLVRVLDHGMPVQQAVQGPHHTHGRNTTDLEPPLRERKVARALEKWGHKVRFAQQGSGLHAIRIDPKTGRLHAGVDPRREGLAAGY